MYDPIKPHAKTTLDLIKKTWKTPYVTVKDGVYPTIKKKFTGLEIDHTDGIGTKGIYHWKKRTFKNAVLDALAMNLNDIAIARAIPYKLQNHITVPTEDKRLIEILKVLSQECVKRKIAITGGETSFHNDTKAIDISITVSGFITKDRPNKCKTGDTLIGLASNGLHSNGFTLIRKIFGREYRKEFIAPTHIYFDTILKLEKSFTINGMMHITGGAFTKLKNILANNDAIIKRDHTLKPQPIFQEIYKRGVPDEKVYTTFNCGVGFILSVPKNQEEVCLRAIKDFKADIIGEVVEGYGKVKIESMFSNKQINL